ncbi:MAG: HD-GYP domain-containing protein [Candidatus Eremiobacteraeota bacterium]|nr:HD-GYP domain-containing protein [Candidatus Eremiobacteraeota bacterium]
MLQRMPVFRTIEAHKEEIAATLAEVVPGVERTLMVELLADAFVESFTGSVRDGNLNGLIEWVDRMCDVHAETPGVATFFSRVCPAFESYLANHGYDQAYCAPLRALDGPIHEAAEKPRRAARTSDGKLNLVDAAINSMLVRLDGADPLTAEHSRAVAAWCSRLARRLTLSDEMVSFVARCGMIHDIGKVTTPTHILHAPRQLTDEEWAFMRDHTVQGDLIVRADPSLLQFAPMVRGHHERLDGRGYPDKIGGDEIALATRIVTVADCFNAMIGRRPYRPPMSPARALEQLDKNKGTQFDPDVAAAMHDVVREIEAAKAEPATDA